MNDFSVDLQIISDFMAFYYFPDYRFQKCLPLNILIPELCLTFQPDTLSLEARILAFLFLRQVIIQTFERCISQNHDNRQVDDRHDTHEDIREIPYQTELELCADEDNYHRKQAEHVHFFVFQRTACDVVETSLTVEQVAEQCRKCKQKTSDLRKKNKMNKSEMAKTNLIKISKRLNQDSITTFIK